MRQQKGRRVPKAFIIPGGPDPFSAFLKDPVRLAAYPALLLRAIEARLAKEATTISTTSA